MAAKFKMATKTKFACKNYKSSFFNKKNFRAVLAAEIPKFNRNFFSQKFKMEPRFQHGNFFGIIYKELSYSSGILKW
jgi:hypothetical protein